MKRWRVLINGTNFQMPFGLPTKSRCKGFYRVSSAEKSDIPKVRRMGFYTEVFVLGRSPREAELRAVEVLRCDKGLRAAVHNLKDDPPRLFADEIQELKSFRGCRRPRSGLSFYAERGRKRIK
jgi:hypothetical protein